MKNVIKKLAFISIFLFSTHVSAVNFYGGVGYSYNILSAESDFWNGGDGGDPFFILGAKFNRLALELSYRSLTLNNIHTASGGTFDVDVKDSMMTLGLRYDLNLFSHINFGIVRHSVETEYTTTASSRLNTSSIDGSAISFFVGGGLFGPLFIQDLKWIIDLNYYHRNTSFGIFALETGIFYSFYSF
ncbi:conserved hypothetical protein [Halobacteriovorax marinus SJ]|uniref:Outer membrane protein beta-barrel domain-containing protein n=1 Tax=Halobacteriovorax marinus (strain ATCC BAA-682 / DSM 15412 / SJ) TaxID=862908 RepID=E1X617_HALMS|nr:hypothetical protein [Halobacteriovorax marinus]CBW27361.1 conserved hypothetical protein [Halobacteriovorax marinus SJ]